MAGRGRRDADLPRRLPLPAGAQPDHRRTAAAIEIFGRGRYYRPPDFPTPRRTPALSRLRIFLLFAASPGWRPCSPPAAAATSGSSDENPQTVLKDATFEGIENADLDLTLEVDVSGDEGGNVDVSLSGPFQSKGKGQLPELDMSAEASGSVGGKDVDFDGGLVLFPNKAYVNYEGDGLRSRPDDLQLRRIGDRSRQQRKAAPKAAPKAATRLPEGSRRQAQRRRLRRKPDQRRRRRRRRDRDHQGQRRPQRRAGAIDAIIEADRKPGLQLAARSRRPAAARRTRRGAERNRKGAEVRPRRRLRRRRQHRPPLHRRSFDDRTGGLRRKGRGRNRPLAERRQRGTGDLGSRRRQAARAASSRSSASTRSNCSRAPRAAPASAGCSKQLGGATAPNCRASASVAAAAAAAPQSEYLECVQGASSAPATSRTAPRSSSKHAMEGGGTPRLNAAFLRSPYGWPYLLVPLIPVAVALDLAGASARAGLRRGGARDHPHRGADGPRHRGARGALGPGHRRPAQRHLRQRAGADHRPLRARRGPARGRQSLDRRLDPRQHPARPGRGDARRRASAARSRPSAGPAPACRRRCCCSPRRRC